MTTTESADEILTRLWETNYDPTTREIVESLHPDPAWRCADIGAGGGSMSVWLAERAPAGHVLAVDTDVRFLDPGAAPNLTVRRMDVATEDLPAGSFDFVLLRAVLFLVPDPEELLRRATGWLAPGGWLLAEDFYFMPSEDGPHPNGRAVVEAYIRGMDEGGAHPRIGRVLPARLAGHGLDQVSMRIRPLGPGQGEDENALLRARMQLQGHTLVESGRLTEAQIAEFVDCLDRPDARDVTTLGYSVWGRRPSA